MLFTRREKEFCVLEHARSQSNKTVQHVFVRELKKQSPSAMQIWTWYTKFKEEGCLCRRKGFGRPKRSVETVKRVRRKSMQSSKKSLRRTNPETEIPPTTVWRMMRKRLIMKPCKIQRVQVITAEDKRKRKPN